MGKKTVKDYIVKHGAEVDKIAMDIWAKPEAGFRENFASKTQIDYLQGLGAKITAPVGVVDTAFIAEYGSGYPIIGILGEFDALPGLSQKAGTTVREPVVEGAYGHACGHNVLGSAGVLAFAALMETMRDEKLSGTIRYYACPAEENLSGKSYMARDGAFDDLDCCLSWHPAGKDEVSGGSCNAFQLMEFFFTGTEAHAGGAPHMGRSALDAVEIMDIGANYLREHIIDQARLHYVITDGGLAPNIVPGKAAVRYAVRAPKMQQMQDIVARLIKCAEGAAHMTETTMRYQVQSIYHNVMPNYTINDVMYDNLLDVTQTPFTAEELEFTEKMAATYPEEVYDSLAALGVKREEVDHGMLTKPLKTGDKSKSSGGSTDVGDVSWITPTGQLNTACIPFMVSGHTWQAAACYGTTVATKGMRRAAEVMAASGYDLLTEKKDVIEKAKAELAADRGKFTYTPIPADMKPYLD